MIEIVASFSIRAMRKTSLRSRQELAEARRSGKADRAAAEALELSVEVGS